MMRRIAPLAATLALLVGLLPSAAVARTPGAVVDAATRYLADAQGWYVGATPTDRGLRRGVVRNAWEWQRGVGTASPNMAAIAASALLDAYEMRGDERLLDHALLYGMTLVNDFKESRSLTTPYRQDIAFLARLSAVTGDPSFREAASAWFLNLKGVSPEGDDEISRMLTLRPDAARTLAGYEVAFAIHAAVGVGDVRYASQLADGIWDRRVEWAANAPVRDTWDLTSKAALVSAFVALDADRYGPAIDHWVAELIAAQGGDGSWLGATQPTAYALRALSQAPGSKARHAAGRAAAWLAKSMRTDGSWPSNARVTRVARPNVEVQAEALAAYVAFLKAS